MSSAQRKRYDAIDIARAFALIAMALYHIVWDLADFGFLPPAAPFTPQMRYASNAIAAAFLALVGVSFALANRGGLHSGAVAKRIAVIGAAAAFTTAATFAVEPEAPIFFGILHCICVASLLAAPLMRIPAYAACALGATAILAPRVFSSKALDAPLVLWIGLGLHEPTTVDWRPLLPWGGIVWFALGVARLLPKGFWDSRFMAAQARTGAMWVLKWLGRHSLAFYLAHQPILFGLLFVATSGLGFGAAGEREAFLAACRPACVESGGAIETCAHSCACVADKSIRATIGARFLSLLQPETGNVKLTVEACAIDSQ